MVGNGTPKRMANDGSNLRVSGEHLVGLLVALAVLNVAPEGDLRHIVVPISCRMRPGHIHGRVPRVSVSLLVGPVQANPVFQRPNAPRSLQQWGPQLAQGGVSQ